MFPYKFFHLKFGGRFEERLLTRQVLSMALKSPTNLEANKKNSEGFSSQRKTLRRFAKISMAR
jgi:hypothetical protein